VIFSTSFDDKAKWWATRSFKHFQVEIARIYGVFYDIPAWGVSEQVRLLSKQDNEWLQFAFADRSRATIKFVAKPLGVLRVEVYHESLADENSALNRAQFWKNLFDYMAKRLICEPLTVVSAPGKINLFFKVGKLNRNGFHDVASIYQAVNLREQVVVELSHEWRVAVSGNLSSEHIAAVPTGEDNLVVRAAKATAAVSDKAVVAPVAFAIEKVVPVAGGMGGGSADAAAAILAVNQLWGLNLSESKLHRVAAELGADVPFALQGSTAVGTGKGDKLVPLEAVPTLHWVLLPDVLGLSTPAVYRRLDELRAARGENPKTVENPEIPAKLLLALKRGDPAKIAPLLQNDLQEAALSLRPDLQKLIDAALDAGALTAMISGSGPTIALLAANAQDAAAIASRMRPLAPDAIATWGPAEGATIED
jgi:4-diphosphocytidyl-2-C-methyl-D-erythritol kinase